MIRAILVDDEQLALRHLETQLLKTGRVEVVGKFSNATDVLKEMKNLDFDVAFLDIEMPGLSGLDLADLIIDWNSDVFIVFATAYREYAVQAFELDSIDYLLKPIMLERLEKTTARIQDQLQIRNSEKEKVPMRIESLTIDCFKEFNVLHNGTPVKWKTVKVKELFAYFFMHLNHSIQRDMLIETLWPDVDYQRAKIQLHTAMSYLRKLLDELGHSNAITFSSGSYTLKLEGFESDIHQLEAISKNEHVITSDNLGLIEKVIQQYDGDYMEDSDYEWATTKAQEIRQKLLNLLQMLVDYFDRQQNVHQKQKYLQQLVALNPYSEHATQQLMQHYVAIGNRGEAVRVYHEIKSILIEDLGILPDQSTTQLYDSILQG